MLFSSFPRRYECMDTGTFGICQGLLFVREGGGGTELTIGPIKRYLKAALSELVPYLAAYRLVNSQDNINLLAWAKFLIHCSHKY